MKDQITKERFIELRGLGWSYDKIAKELKTSKQTLIQWSKVLQTDISNLKAIQLESLREQYGLTKQGRIELLGNKLQALKTEMDKRELTDIPTEKIFHLVLKYADALKEEAIDPQFSNRSLFGITEMIEGQLETWAG